MAEAAFGLAAGWAAAALLAAGAVLWLRTAAPLLDPGSKAARWLDGGLLLAWLAVVGFYLLASLGVFRIWVAVAAAVGSGLLLRARPGARVRPASTSSVGAPQLETPSARDPWLWAALPLLALAAVRLVKSMASPPLAWDALTMHLPKAAFWIQSASLDLPDFPDAWTYYRWFPGAGEALFAWVMLPLESDLLLGPFGAVVWLGIVVAGARLARELGADSRLSWLAGAALAGLPTATVFMTANYVDNLVVLFVLLAVAQALAFAREPGARPALASLAAAGLAIGVKTTALVVVAPVVAAVAFLAWGHRAHLPGWSAPAFAAALVLPCVGYLHTWVHTGSPFYPLRAPIVPLPYHQGLADLFAGRGLLPEGTVVSPSEVLWKLFWSPPLGQGHMNFGLGGLLLAAIALWGIVRALRSGSWVVLWLTVAGALAALPLIFSDANLALYTIWVGVIGRHLLPALAPVAMLAALAPERAGRPVLAASLLAGTLHALPMGWSPATVGPAVRIALALGLGLAAIVLLARLGRTMLGPRVRFGVAAAIAIVVLGTWTTVRDRARYPIYREATREGGAFDAHPLHPAFATAAGLWPLLDTSQELVIATTVGRDQVGHNQFFYPLLGSRLQNRLRYVLVSGSIDEVELDPEERYRAARPALWIEGLEEADLVVGLWKPTPERDWLAQRSEEFETVALTSLGAPWVAQRHDGPRLWPESSP